MLALPEEFGKPKTAGPIPPFFPEGCAPRECQHPFLLFPTLAAGWGSLVFSLSGSKIRPLLFPKKEATLARVFG